MCWQDGSFCFIMRCCLSSLRINLAKQLLRTTDLQISAIAARVGYQNAYSFARFFKLNVGCAPNEYRKQLGVRL